jgi:hypothetical protein
MQETACLWLNGDPIEANPANHSAELPKRWRRITGGSNEMQTLRELEDWLSNGHNLRNTHPSKDSQCLLSNKF